MNEDIFKTLSNDRSCVLVLDTNNKHAMAEQRRVFIDLINNHLDTPVIIRRKYDDPDKELVMLYASTDIAGLLIDGLGNGVWIESESVGPSFINSISFGILQAARRRI